MNPHKIPHTLFKVHPQTCNTFIPSMSYSLDLYRGINQLRIKTRNKSMVNVFNFYILCAFSDTAALMFITLIQLWYISYVHVYTWTQYIMCVVLLLIWNYLHIKHTDLVKTFLSLWRSANLSFTDNAACLYINISVNNSILC